MVLHCHRCGGTLDEDGLFCPHCAAPQLGIEAREPAAERETPLAASALESPRGVDWGSVVRLAVLLSIPVGLVAPFFFPMVIVGPVVMISLYQRERPRTPLDGRSGLRMGALMGLLAAYVSAFGLAAWQLCDRYLLHRASAMDAQYALQVQQSAETTRRMTQSSAVDARQAKMMLDFFLSPEGRVTYTLFSTVVMACGIVLLAALGGLLGARLSRRAAAR
jgi:hypothetical protein